MPMPIVSPAQTLFPGRPGPARLGARQWILSFLCSYWRASWRSRRSCSSRASTSRRASSCGDGCLPRTAADSRAPSSQSVFGALVSDTFTEERFGVDSNLRQKLRRNLLRAGFFSPHAIRYYVFARF